MTNKTAVLFDFDGTLADTAADLAAALNRMRVEQGQEPMPVERLRPFASAGARGLLFAGFGTQPEDAEYAAQRETFLEYYAEEICVHTRLFPGMEAVLDELVRRKIAWGIVTNKATRFTEPLVAALKLEAACVVCGDSTPHLKPHPAPLLLAAQQLQRAPGECFYLGDDLRDIQAAQAAGMRPIAVQWGYHHPDREGPHAWNAEAVLARPEDTLALLQA